LRPQDHLKRDATANLLKFHRNCGVWWQLLHNSGYKRNGIASLFMMFAPLEGWR
jgi:hypothetical protein